MNDLSGYVTENEEEFASFFLAALDSVAPTSTGALISKFLKQEIFKLKVNGFEELASELALVRINHGQQLVRNSFKRK